MPAAWCQIDHSTEWHQHGATDQDNAATLCGFNNVDKHRKKQTNRRDVTGQLHAFRADGTIILPVGVRPPVFPDESDDADHDESDRDELALRRERRAAIERRRTPIVHSREFYRTLVEWALEQPPAS